MFRLLSKTRVAINMWKTHGGMYVFLFAFARLFPSNFLFRRWANAISRSRLPETLVSLSGVYTNQAWSQRMPVLEALAEAHLSSSFVALEIGTWFGQGSTQIWCKHLKSGSQLFLIDSWKEYISDADKARDTAYSAMDGVHHIAINSVLKNIYEQEKKAAGKIYLLRGKASDVCNFFKPNTFDFIYIDGSHYYEQVKEDIRLAKILIKEGGIIAGDDLEAAPTESRLALAKENLDRDFIQCEGENVSFHPGVLLAVYESFPAVTNNTGIWTVVKRGDQWIAP
jgi:predicted O-methyltransferase YrrM